MNRKGTRAGLSPWTVAAVIAHLVILVFPISATGVLAPPAGVAAAGALWIAGGIWIYAKANSAWRVLLGPIATVALWLLMMTLGDAWFGWVA